MTIRADVPPRDWCPSCDEVRPDPGRICSVCGTELLHQQEAQPRIAANDGAADAPPPPRRREGREWRNEVVRLAGELARQEEASLELRSVLLQMRDLTERMGRQSERIAASNHQILEMLNGVLLEQQQAGEGVPWDPAPVAPLSRPTSSSYLDGLPRVVLEPTSALLFRGILTVGDSLLQCQAIPGEFGGDDRQSVAMEDCRLVVVAHPHRTGRGGLSADTCRRIRECGTNPCVLYFERGDITFVQKGFLAQQAGAMAVVVGNTVEQPWPYTMRDSTDEATKVGLSIPVVMVKQADAKAIVTLARSEGDLPCRLEVQSSPPECVVCLNQLQVGDKVLSIPACGHAFHEECVVAWLRAHNTCPYCRRELPTDDAAYEQERRRTQRTHAGHGPAPGRDGNRTDGADDFYR